MHKSLIEDTKITTNL